MKWSNYWVCDISKDKRSNVLSLDWHLYLVFGCKLGASHWAYIGRGNWSKWLILRDWDRERKREKERERLRDREKETNKSLPGKRTLVETIILFRIVYMFLQLFGGREDMMCYQGVVHGPVPFWELCVTGSQWGEYRSQVYTFRIIESNLLRYPRTGSGLYILHAFVVFCISFLLDFYIRYQSVMTRNADYFKKTQNTGLLLQFVPTLPS